jgi:energy-coupling factor transporter ATP-binding protein EcfA2
VQLLRVVLYNEDGRTRTVEFEPGVLNVIVGNSGTGKSALLDIVDYCMGQDDAPAFPGIIGHTCSWVGCLWSLDGGSRVFVARPRPSKGKATSTVAAIRLGGNDLAELSFAELEVNLNSDQLREQLGALVGLNDIRVARSDADGESMTVTLGTASVFSFQNQDEIAGKSQLFHRAQDPQLRRRLQDAFPFFLGAVDGDQSKRQADLRAAEYVQKQQEAALARAEDDAERVEADLRALLHEAYTVGLISAEAESPDSRRLVLELLRSAVANTDEEPVDTTTADRSQELRQRQRQLRNQLATVMENRTLLLEASSGASGYESAISQQAGRLQSLQLVGDSDGGQLECPVCRQALRGDDPLPEQLTHRLTRLRADIEHLITATPGRQRALDETQGQIDQLRGELVAVDAALVTTQIASTSGTDRRSDASRRAFIRGRIDATLRGTRPVDEAALATLRERLQATGLRVSSLREQLDDAEVAELLESLLHIISEDITNYAARLGVENAGRSVRLDVRKLTIVADTLDGPRTLRQIGSGGNWVGYHIAAHLALHRFFVQQKRPTPRILMLDQPSQPFSEGKQREGNTDPDAVRRVFELLRDIASELAPRLQIILCEHAELDDAWFKSAIRETWRGHGLIPRDWADEEEWSYFESGKSRSA